MQVKEKLKRYFFRLDGGIPQLLSLKGFNKLLTNKGT